LLASSSAAAFCRSTTCSGNCERDADNCKIEGAPLYWSTMCVGFSLNEQASEFLPFDAFRAVAVKSVASWSSLACPQGEATVAFLEQRPVSCHQTEFNPSGGNVNVILFQDHRWSYQGADNTLAKTTVTYDKVSGEILDADIELNHAYNELTVSDDPDEIEYDLQSILTHELGHLLGLDHTSDPDGTMNAAYDRGSTELRSIEEDDVAGICTIYPATRKARCDPSPKNGFDGECGEVVDSGCSLTSKPAPMSLPTLILLTATLAAARRSRRGWTAQEPPELLRSSSTGRPS
jgi:hypothetical protein